VARRGGAPAWSRTRWYRIVRGDDDAVLDWLSITAVERIRSEAGVDIRTLVPVVDGAVAGDDGTAAHGVGTVAAQPRGKRYGGKERAFAALLGFAGCDMARFGYRAPCREGSIANCGHGSPMPNVEI
jgi:hypothetical protein